ncbi:MAG: YlxR family protein [Alphaproteobacteria bacterium]|nr:MAG: YlxR family protein [Alphaproteobacteria bacterium]
MVQGYGSSHRLPQNVVKDTPCIPQALAKPNQNMKSTPMTSPYTPIRTCAATGQKLPQAQLLRFVNVGGVPTPEVLLHPTRRAPGRGVYIVPTPDALAAAVKRKAFANRLKTNQPPVAWTEIAPFLQPQAL